MAASADRCSHCGKAGVGLKRCSRCKQASYCGAACQNAGWKGHKKTCAPPVPLPDIAANMLAADAAGDWRGVLKLEGRLGELMAPRETYPWMELLPDDVCETTLHIFSKANRSGFNATGSDDHARSFVGLEERRIPLLAKLQRFRDQGEAMCGMNHMLTLLDRQSEASTWLQRARDVGAAHGFFSVESLACRGLGRVAINEGRHEEGVALLRNALAAAQLNETDEPTYEIPPLAELVDVLFTAEKFDEAEPLLLRYREAAKAWSEKEGRFAELQSLFFTARFHEARGRPEEAATAMRALLDLMRGDEAIAQTWGAPCAATLRRASQLLNVLDPEVGDQELIQAVAHQLATLPS